MGLRSSAALTLAGVACATSALAWQQQRVQAESDPTFRVDVRLVRLLATVKDNHGRPLAGLTDKDFTITDNGIPQQITLFERHTAQPLSVAMVRALQLQELAQ